jgi:hypothetical protein
MKGYFVDQESEQLRLDCYNAGMLDPYAANKCNMTATGYRSWRYRRNLASNNKTKMRKDEYERKMQAQTNIVHEY